MADGGPVRKARAQREGSSRWGRFGARVWRARRRESIALGFLADITARTPVPGQYVLPTG